MNEDSDLPAAQTKYAHRRLPALELEWLAPIGKSVARDTHFNLINRYNRRSPHADLGYLPGQAFEITSALYTHFLNVVPPLSMVSGSFACGEMTTDALVDTYHEADGRYFCVTVEWHGRDTLYQAWAAILKCIVETRE